MNKYIFLTAFILISFIGYSQIIVQPVAAGQYAVRNMSSGSYVTPFSRGGTVSYNPAIADNTVDVVDTVIYIASGTDLSTVSFTKPTGKKPAYLLRRGTTYTGTATIAGDSILIGAYGNGPKPKIYGSEVITGWTLHSGNIWKGTFNSDITQVFVNGKKMKNARLENTSYSDITGLTSTTVFTANITSQAANYYVGCRVIVKQRPFFSTVRTVTASAGSTLTLNSAIADLQIGQGLILMNKLEFLDQAGEWFYDTATNTVYLWKLDGTQPTNTEVRGSSIDLGIDINSKSYVTVKNLEILQQRQHGIYSGNNTFSNVTIDNCVVDGAELYGIYMFPGAAFATGQDLTITNNVVKNVNAAGIYGYYTVGTVSDNVVSDISLFEEWSLNGTTDTGNGIGIAWSSTGSTTGRNRIAYNTINKTGYNGIMWRGPADIEYNYVDSTMLNKNDGGAIYCGSVTGEGSVVRYNIVTNSIGEEDGSVDAFPFAEGIYLDEAAKGIKVEYNTVINSSSNGLYFHRPGGLDTIRYNTSFDNRRQLQLKGSDATTNINLITNNLLINGSATDPIKGYQVLSALGPSFMQNPIYVTLNNNQYLNPFPQNLAFINQLIGGSETSYNFADWKTATSQDAASTYDATLLGSKTHRVVYNATKTAQTYYLNNATEITDKDNASVTQNFILAPFTSKYIRGNGVNAISAIQVNSPNISIYNVPANYPSLDVPITFTALDTDGIAGYYISETGTTPALNAGGWVANAPTSYTFTTEGTKTLYGWAKDAVGNISVRVSGSVTISNIMTNVVAWYEGDSATSTVINDAVSASVATFFNSPTINQTGQYGKAVLFNGTNQYATIPMLSSVFAAGMPNSFSVMIRFQQPTLGVTKRLFEVPVGTNDYLHFRVDNGIFTGQLAKNGTRYSKKKASNIAASTWYNAVITWNAATSTLNFYVNGVEETTAGTENGVNGASASMWIARTSLEPTYTNELLETISVFNKILTQGEIEYLQDKEYSDL